MEVVIVEFENSASDTEGCVAALNQLMTEVVSKQPAFISARVHVEQSSGVVVNVMHWQRAADFFAFRDANGDIIGPALGKYGPKGRAFNVAFEL